MLPIKSVKIGKSTKNSFFVLQMKCCTPSNMIDTLTYNAQPENWLYEITQKGHDSTCYVMVPHASVGFTSFSFHFLSSKIILNYKEEKKSKKQWQKWCVRREVNETKFKWKTKIIMKEIVNCNFFWYLFLPAIK